MKKVLEIGDRVFMIHEPDALGTVVNKMYVGPKGPRQAVHWDYSDLITDWDPAFLFPEGTDISTVGDIRSGKFIYDSRAKKLYKIEKSSVVEDDSDEGYPM